MDNSKSRQRRKLLLNLPLTLKLLGESQVRMHFLFMAMLFGALSWVGSYVGTVLLLIYAK
ncbi:hypothetical protein QO002_005766 [Pararhizobium capsulatum DSM 1112]|uniref:Uncharacterized protein n=1 Tax=Pararhizobium capsulatum DSM 1112 TaxID=1121113 RepID=A0ABU0BZ99_9HYPH|nr:hypothetical protein [Pararhizobium capsulatum DSM 1112]